MRQFSFATSGEGENSSFKFGFEFYERDRISCVDRFPDKTALTFDSGSVWAFFRPAQSGVFNSISEASVPNWSTIIGIPIPEGGYVDFSLELTGTNCFGMNPQLQLWSFTF